MRWHGAAPLMLLGLATCGGDDGSSDSDGVSPVATADTGPQDCPPGSLVTWQTFGSGFIDTWCTTCHSKILTGDARYGAPEGLDFNTYDQVAASQDRIVEQAALGEPPPMPPAGGTTDAERDRLVEWVACGAPL